MVKVLAISLGERVIVPALAMKSSPAFAGSSTSPAIVVTGAVPGGTDGIPATRQSVRVEAEEGRGVMDLQSAARLLDTGHSTGVVSFSAPRSGEP
jgi:hypothetical protein